MAGSIAYTSFPRFSRRRKLPIRGVLEMYAHLTVALTALSDITSCFSRPGRNSRTIDEDESRQDDRASGLQRADLSNTPNQDSPKVNSSSSPGPSHHSIPGRLRAGLNRSFSSRRSENSHTEPANDPIATDPFTTTAHSHDSNDTLKASPDALSISHEDLDLLKRMEQVCSSTRAARDRRKTKHDPADASNQSAESHPSNPFTNPLLDLCLRGGGDDPPCRRTTLPFIPPKPPQPDSARPNAALWWLAGGRISRKGQVPTLGELRARREVEVANRRIVGFWGTVSGVRRVGKVGILGEGDGGGDGGGGGDDETASESGGDGGDDAESELGYVREREVEHGEVVGAKVEDVPRGAGADSVNDAAEVLDEAVGTTDEAAKARGEMKAESMEDEAGVGPEEKAEGVKSVVEDTEKTVGDTEKAEVETTPQAEKAESSKHVVERIEKPEIDETIEAERAERARIVVEDREKAEAEEIMEAEKGDGVAEGQEATEVAEESKTKAPSNV